MDTTWRNTTVKSNLILRHGSSLVLGIALLFSLVAVQGIAQIASGTSGAQAAPPAMPGAGSAIPSAKSGTANQGMGPFVLPKDFSQLRIEPGDLLSVNVYDTPEFTDAYRVDTAGDLTLPLCGKVKVQGLTLREVAGLLEATLKNGQILIRPQVNVDLVQYAGDYVTVLGEVVNPGRVTLIGPTRLSEVLAQAGGITSLAGAHIKVHHEADDGAPEVEVPYSRSQRNGETASVLVRPGDLILVPRAGIIYVLGAVARPGGYVMQEDGKLNVAEALALSGGTLMQAKTGGLRVIRRNPDGTVLDFSLSYDGIAKGAQTPLELQAKDIVYVPMSKLKATFADATGILSAATSAAIYTSR
jgi:polysaccharide export outer membrane protein